MSEPLSVRVVIVTAFPPELEGWLPAVPLFRSVPFPAGGSPDRPPLWLNPDLGVVGVTTGMGPSRAASSIMALGYE